MIGDDVIAIAAPFPAPDQLQEGWMRRIDSIDRQLRGVRRIYLSFSDSHDDEEVSVIWRDDERGVAYVHPSGKRSVALISEILGEVSLVYVHTLHYAEFLLRWLKRGRICVDIHGVTPEEEVMLGRPNLKERYENVERRVLNEALRCIAVSDAMIDHYREKYPDISPRWLTIPILEHTSDLSVLGERISEGQFHSPYRVIYSGGTQAWQNIGAMLEMVRRCGDTARFAFYSQHHEVLREQAEALWVAGHIEFGFKTTEQLKDVYTAADFGLILRDESRVNWVSCPTKLAEYLQFGIVPIVRSPRLGDFYTHRFAYVTEEEFLAGNIPDSATRDWIIRQNARVLAKIGHRFSEGVAQLRQLIIQGVLPKSPRRLNQRKRTPMTIKKVGEAYVAKGTVYAAGPVIDEDSGVRTSDIYVSLPQRLYNEPPILFVALGSIDFQKGTNSRLEVSVLENSVTKDEFCVRFRTWADTKVWSAYANWMAVGDASGEDDEAFYQHFKDIDVSYTHKLRQAALQAALTWRTNASINDSVLDSLYENVPSEVMSCRGQLSIDDRLLYYWAGLHFFEGAGTVVDGGALVGSSATAFAAGLRANPVAHRAGARPIHVYDLFEDAWDGYSARLIREWYGEEPPTEIYDFEAHFQRNTSCFSELLDVHKGDITKIGYRDNRDIEVLSIDVAKTPDLMHYIAIEFFPHLIPERSIVLHQDYLFSFQPWLVIAMELMDDLFERIYDVPTQSASVFVPRQRITASQVRQRLGDNGAAYYRIENAALIERAAKRSLAWRAQVHLTAAASYFHLAMGNLQTAQMMAMRMIQQFDVSRRFIESTDLKDLFVDHLHLDLNRIC